MKTRGKAIRAAAFIAAAALTAGALLPYQNAGFTVSRLTAYADETKTEGKEGPFSYFKYSDRVEIISCDMSVTSVEIPTTIDGLPVTAIDMYAFECSKLKTITIPESIERIGYWSFAMFSELESVYLPDSLKLIEMHAFEACPKLETIVFPDHLVEVHSKAFEDTPWLAAQRAKDKVVIVNGTVVDARTAEGDIVLPQYEID